MDNNDMEVKITYEELVNETEKALLIKIKGKKHWFPKSQLKHDSATKTATIKEWLLVDKGLKTPGTDWDPRYTKELNK